MKMLVLSRRCGESIQIAEDVYVTVFEVKGGRVRLAIDAPREVVVFRKELTEKVEDS